jgi:hypothetical protein
MTGGDGKPLLVVGVEECLHEVAAAVLRLMYEEVVPDEKPALQLAQVCTGLSPQSLQGAYSRHSMSQTCCTASGCVHYGHQSRPTLISTFNQTRSPVSHAVQMCKVADMWDAPGCMGCCLKALAQLTASELDLQGRMTILQLLPDAAQQLVCDHSIWVQRCVEVVCEGVSAGKDAQALLLHLFGDVHALLTSPDLLQHFRQLSFTAIKAWADSDDLVVDSEDSVAVALGWWAAGAEGSKCSEEQLKELSGLVRLRHMSAGEQQITACQCRPMTHCLWVKCVPSHAES